MNRADVERNKRDLVHIDKLNDILGSYRDKIESEQQKYVELIRKYSSLKRMILKQLNKREATSSATGTVLKGDRAFDDKLKSSFRKCQLLKDQIARLQRKQNRTRMKNEELRDLVDSKRHQRERNKLKIRTYAKELEKIQSDLGKLLSEAATVDEEVENNQISIDEMIDKDEKHERDVSEEMENLAILISSLRADANRSKVLPKDLTKFNADLEKEARRSSMSVSDILRDGKTTKSAEKSSGSLYSLDDAFAMLKEKMQCSSVYDVVQTYNAMASSIYDTYAEIESIRQEHARIRKHIESVQADIQKYKICDTNNAGLRKLELGASYALKKRLVEDNETNLRECVTKKRALVWYLIEAKSCMNGIASSGALQLGSAMSALRPSKQSEADYRVYEEIVMRVAIKMNDNWLNDLREQKKRIEKESRRGGGDDNSSVFSSLTKRSRGMRNLGEDRFGRFGRKATNMRMRRSFFADAMERAFTNKTKTPVISETRKVVVRSIFRKTILRASQLIRKIRRSDKEERDILAEVVLGMNGKTNGGQVSQSRDIKRSISEERSSGAKDDATAAAAASTKQKREPQFHVNSEENQDAIIQRFQRKIRYNSQDTFKDRVKKLLKSNLDSVSPNLVHKILVIDLGRRLSAQNRLIEMSSIDIINRYLAVQSYRKLFCQANGIEFQKGSQKKTRSDTWLPKLTSKFVLVQKRGAVADPYAFSGDQKLPTMPVPSNPEEAMKEEEESSDEEDSKVFNVDDFRVSKTNEILRQSTSPHARASSAVVKARSNSRPLRTAGTSSLSSIAPSSSDSSSKRGIKPRRKLRYKR